METDVVVEKARVEKEQEIFSKRVGDELEHEEFKKQKLDDQYEKELNEEESSDKGTADLQLYVEIKDKKEEEAIEVEPLATKYCIIDWKVRYQGKKAWYELMRASGKSQKFIFFPNMIKSIDREDLDTLWKLVKAKYGYVRPEEIMDRGLSSYLKDIFEPNLEDEF